jgi:hypothetical protein
MTILAHSLAPVVRALINGCALAYSTEKGG